MDEFSKHRQDFSISSYELNPLAKARLSTLANYFQEVAYHHANLLGFGYEDLKKQDTVWLLSRMKIRVDRYPVWNDMIRVETWPSGTNRLFAQRDFRVLDREGSTLAIASTSWLVVDLETHRPLRSGPVIERFLKVGHGPYQFEKVMEKIPELKGDRKTMKRRVVYSDLDIVGHVNNVKYLEWCLDMLNSGGKIREIREFEINFLHECRLNENIELSMSGPAGMDSGGSASASADSEGNVVDRACVFNGAREKDGTEVFRARALW